jgi:hypothetical protein
MEVEPAVPDQPLVHRWRLVGREVVDRVFEIIVELFLARNKCSNKRMRDREAPTLPRFGARF